MRIASELLARLYFSVTLVATIANAQSTIREQIQQTYNFQPHTLSNAEIMKKSAALDQF